jgi:C4-dicarboxylate-binding protein DctP
MTIGTGILRAAMLTATGFALVTAAGPSLAQKITMKIGFVTVNDSQHESAKMFKTEIEARTNGAIEAKIFPLAQLGRIPRQLEGIQLGTQEAFNSPPGFFVGINQAFQAPDAPALFESQWHQHVTLNHPSVRDKFLKLGEHAGIVGNYVWSAGKTAIATSRQVLRPDDLKGQKIRVLASKTESGFIAEFGGTGVPMPFSEVLPALQRKVIDGVRSGIIVMGPLKFYTVAKHIYNEAMGQIPSGMWLSKAFLNKLSANHRDAVFASGRAVADRTGKVAVEITVKWEKLWIENGGTLTEPSAEDRAAMARRAAPIGERILGGNPKIKPMYDLIKAAAAETRGAKPPM